MPLKQITFSKKYPYAQFLNYDIGYVWDMVEGENREEIETMLNKWADEKHKKDCPQFYQEQNSVQIISQWEDKYHTKYPSNEIVTVLHTTKTEEKISPEQEIEDTLKGIEEATAETILTWRLPAAKSQKTMGAYNRRKKQLGIS